MAESPTRADDNAVPFDTLCDLNAQNGKILETSCAQGS